MLLDSSFSQWTFFVSFFSKELKMSDVHVP